jgi:uncharacterized membrane protein YfcA
MQNERTYIEYNSCRGAFKYLRPAVKDKNKRKILLVVCGVLIGAVNGLLGAGGGMLAVPVLTYAAGLDERRSHATAIAVILPLCLISAVVYALKGTHDDAIMAPTVGGVILGSLAGALLLKKAGNTFLNLFFYGIMILAGLRMIF